MTMMEILLVAAIGVGLAFGANALRPKETRVDVHYGYIKPPPPRTDGAAPQDGAGRDAVGDPSSGHVTRPPDAHPVQPSDRQRPSNEETDGGTDGDGDLDPPMAVGRPQGGVSAPPPRAGRHVEHEFQKITADQILVELDSPDLHTGLTVIIDARDDDHFRGPDGGRIPGAIQCFPYEPARFLPVVEPYVTNAMKVIVYCNGGACDDSVMMCRTFRDELGVMESNLFLYEGGWEDWQARKLPIEKGEE